MKSLTKSLFLILFCSTFLVSVVSCQTAPKNAVPVTNFDVMSYLGKWFEIARLDFQHEKDMSNVTATYLLNDDGSIKVVNRGYDYVDGEWKESVGKAKFIGDPTVGALKVSFFGPFYSGYNVVALDDNYQTALVVGKDTNYMWILSRTTAIPDTTKLEYLALASKLGFDVNKLVWVDQGPYDASIYDAK